MIERWSHSSINDLTGAVEKYRRGNEGDLRQALAIADGATETLMRSFLIFEHGEDPPYDYPDLLKKVADRAKLPAELVETISAYRLIRDGFQHHNIKKLERALKGTTVGLTLEKGYLREYLKAVSNMVHILTGEQIDIP
jgi:hypothetical protein